MKAKSPAREPSPTRSTAPVDSNYQRKDFSDEFEGWELTIKKVTLEVARFHDCGGMTTPVGIYLFDQLVALVDMSDLYDNHGMRFYDA